MTSKDTSVGFTKAAAVALVLLFISRYLPSPWAVFVADDWPNWARSGRYASHGEATLTALTDPNRPLSMAAVELAYRWFQDRPMYWTALSLISHGLMLLFIMRMGLEVTGSVRIAFLQGLVFALLPNLTETWHWSTQIVNEATCGLLFYALSGWLFSAYVRRGRAARLVASALSYGIALFSYEQGILLPAAYAVLLPWGRRFTRSMLALLPFGVVLAAYAAWRLTNAFGLNQSWYYPPHMRAEGFSLWFVFWNARQVAKWWVGDRFFGAVLSGLQSFSLLPLWPRRILGFWNLIVVFGVLWTFRRWWGEKTLESESSKVARSGFSAAAFVVAWFFTAISTTLISYTAGRLNVLPAMGVSLGIAMLLDRVPARAWQLLLMVPAWICLAANQGTTESFRQVGEFNRRIYQRLIETRADWQDKEVLLFDTASLRHRLTPGLLAPVSEHESVWAEYNNALLVRGFVPLGMVQRITGQREPPVAVVHDVECGARIEGNRLLWHVRYDPSRPRETPLDRVFVLDVWAVGARP